MLTAEQYRAKAAKCTELLKAASLPAEVHGFRALERSYLTLAENEEWMVDNRDKMNIRGSDENSYGDDAIPTSDESGAPGLYMSEWFGFFAPKGTPKDIIAKLNGAMVEALADPAVRKRFADLGLDVAPPELQTPEGPATFQSHRIILPGQWAPAESRRKIREKQPWVSDILLSA
jgi:hypothetical protein